MARAVPFFANTKDNMHCYQASLRMVLAHFLPKRHFTWKKLEAMTGMKRGCWTWNTLSIMQLHEMDFSIIDMALFDAEAFIKKGKHYLIEVFGKEAGEAQARFSDLPTERRRMKEYLKLGIWQNKAPTLRDVRRLLCEGYLVICNLNSHALDGIEGYAGHSVLVFDIDDKHVTLHDPGLPPRRNRKVPRAVFSRAWAYPDKKARNLLALRYP